jgi:hypothetical protein
LTARVSEEEEEEEELMWWLCGRWRISATTKRGDTCEMMSNV